MRRIPVFVQTCFPLVGSDGAEAAVIVNEQLLKKVFDWSSVRYFPVISSNYAVLLLIQCLIAGRPKEVPGAFAHHLIFFPTKSAKMVSSRSISLV
jgi:hypothetical protein